MIQNKAFALAVLLLSSSTTFAQSNTRSEISADFFEFLTEDIRDQSRRVQNNLDWLAEIQSEIDSVVGQSVIGTDQALERTRKLRSLNEFFRLSSDIDFLEIKSSHALLLYHAFSQNNPEDLVLAQDIDQNLGELVNKVDAYLNGTLKSDPLLSITMAAHHLDIAVNATSGVTSLSESVRSLEATLHSTPFLETEGVGYNRQRLNNAVDALTQTTSVLREAWSQQLSRDIVWFKNSLTRYLAYEANKNNGNVADMSPALQRLIQTNVDMVQVSAFSITSGQATKRLNRTLESIEKGYHLEDTPKIALAKEKAETISDKVSNAWSKTVEFLQREVFSPSSNSVISPRDPRLKIQPDNTRVQRRGERYRSSN